METGSHGAAIEEGNRKIARRRRSDSASVRDAVDRRPVTRGERVIAFIERYCIVPEGMLIGKPMRLLPFQKRFILDVYDNPARTSTAILSMARKNGKTSLIAALVLAHLVGPEAQPNSQIVSGAMSRDQASLVFKLACKMVMQSEILRPLVRIVLSRKLMVGLARNVEYEAISAEAKTKHGLSPVLAILDEIGQVRGASDPFVDAIITAQGAHANPLLIAISTQAPSDGDMLSIWIDDARTNKDPHTVCHVYEAPAGVSIMDESAWRQANPALGEFRSLDDLRIQAERALRMPSAENTFRNLCLNQRVELHAPFVSRNAWSQCDRPIDEDLFKRRPVYAGLDLSSRVDLTALVLAVSEDDSQTSPIHVKPVVWTPAEGLVERARTDRAPYDQWVRDGFMIATPGNAVDYSYVAAFIAQLIGSGVRLEKLAYDRWRIDLLKKELARIGVHLLLVPHGQGYKDMSPALDQMEEEIVSGRLRHGGHPVLTMSAMSSVVEKDAAGNRKITKARSSGRIDAMVAAVMAVGLLRANNVPVAPMIGVF